MLALMFAQGSRLLLQVVPHALVEFSRNVMRERFSAFIHKPVQTFLFNRGVVPGPSFSRRGRIRGHSDLLSHVHFRMCSMHHGIWWRWFFLYFEGACEPRKFCLQALLQLARWPNLCNENGNPAKNIIFLHILCANQSHSR